MGTRSNFRNEDSANDSVGDSDHALDSLLRKVAHAKTVTWRARLPVVGQVISEKYRIDERLGCGGMGAVFRATHLTTRKPVALKWMLVSTADAAAHHRLLREAAAAGRIDHPNVVNIYDVCQDGDGAYLIMELLHGQSLRLRLEQGPMAAAEVIDLLLPALHGVSAAHRAGVVHRDLKPDNIFLCRGPDGEPREAKVLDFGVSAIQGRFSPQQALTATGELLGTPAYMSPEQLSGQAADARSDIFSLGVILYEALTGRRPFGGDNYPALVLAITTEAPASPRALCPAMDRGLELVLQRALAKRPEDRYPDVDTLTRSLCPFGSASVSMESRSRPWAGRMTRPRALIGVLALACFLGVALVMLAPTSSPSKTTRASSAPPAHHAPSQPSTRSTLLPPAPTPREQSSELPAQTNTPAPLPTTVAATAESGLPSPGSAARDRSLTGAATDWEVIQDPPARGSLSAADSTRGDARTSNIKPRARRAPARPKRDTRRHGSEGSPDPPPAAEAASPPAVHPMTLDQF